MGHVDALAPQHQRTWRATLDLYQRQVIIRDLIFDHVLKILKHRLTRMDAMDEEASPVLVAEVVAALRAVMPIYSASWWRAHDEANRRWMLQLHPHVVVAETWFATRLAQVYGGGWPAEPIRVDLAAYANWAGAYTTHEPDHITIASTDPAYQGDGSLEVLFHEASHIGGLVGPLEEALAAVYRARRETPPPDLWHVMIFYSTGELTRQWLHERGRQEGYEPSADRLGLYTRSHSWTLYRQALATHWQPCLTGTIDCTTALQRIMEALTH